MVQLYYHKMADQVQLACYLQGPCSLQPWRSRTHRRPIASSCLQSLCFLPQHLWLPLWVSPAMCQPHRTDHRGPGLFCWLGLVLQRCWLTGGDQYSLQNLACEVLSSGGRMQSCIASRPEAQASRTVYNNLSSPWSSSSSWSALGRYSACLPPSSASCQACLSSVFRNFWSSSWGPLWWALSSPIAWLSSPSPFVSSTFRLLSSISCIDHQPFPHLKSSLLDRMSSTLAAL